LFYSNYRNEIILLHNKQKLFSSDRVEIEVELPENLPKWTKSGRKENNDQTNFK